MYHNFFIYSSVDGHLGCFHVLAIGNSATMNNGIHVSFSLLAVLALGCWARAFCRCSERGYSLVEVHRLLTIVVSLLVEDGSRAQVQ